MHQRALPLDARPHDPIWPIFTPQGSSLAAARKTGRVTMRTGAVVAEVVLDAETRRARGVRVVDAATKRDEIVEADVVVLAASAFETVRILLASRGPDGEEGLGARSGWLGVGVMDHVTTTCRGAVRDVEAPSTLVEFGGESGVYIPRFQNLPGDRGERGDVGFLRGYGVQVGVQRMPFARGFLMVAVGEMLSDPKNRLTLSADKRDAYGCRVLRIDCRFMENERRMQEHQMSELRAMAERAGFEVRHLGKGETPGAFTHECGGARMGLSASSSVVDARGRVWECPNVFVVDGAAWPTCGSQNPSLTMMAVAGLAAEAITSERRAAT